LSYNSSELNLVYSRMHNASKQTGPGSYQLPDIIGNRSLADSSLKNAPKITFGAHVRKPAYHHETYKDFIGGDSPGIKYFPSKDLVKRSNPCFSLPKFTRFHKPGSLKKLQAALPC